MLKEFINKAHNYSQLLGWGLILGLVTYQVLNNTDQLKTSTDSLLLASPIHLTQIFQSLQALEILLIIVGISSGSLLGTIAQQVGRLVVAYYFLEETSSPLRVVAVLTPWSLAQVNRYVYYLSKIPITTWLRYNAFIILYPIGVFGQMNLINDYIKRHSATLTADDVLYIRVVQGLIIVGFVFLYLYLFKSRLAKSRKSGHEHKNNTKRAVSPKKRD